MCPYLKGVTRDYRKIAGLLKGIVFLVLVNISLREIVSYHGKSSYEDLIEVSMFCADLSDFCSSQIIFKILKEEESQNAEVFESVMRMNEDVIDSWNELNHLFSIVKNYNAYRVTFQSLSFNTPRVPLMFLWLQDMEMLNQLPTFDETKTMVNIEKMMNFKELIEAMRLAKHISYNIKPNTQFQRFLDIF